MLILVQIKLNKILIFAKFYSPHPCSFLHHFWIARAPDNILAPLKLFINKGILRDYPGNFNSDKKSLKL